MPKRWRIATHDPARVAALQSAAGIPSVVAQLLIGRGISDVDGARRFLDAKLTGLRDPEQLPGAVDAAQLIHSAIGAGRRINVYGDYDADGVTASAILLLCLKQLGAKADSYIPNRIDEGYGLNHEALRTIASGGGDVVVTVDCGIASIEEAETARQLGLTLIITDHHQPRHHVDASLRDAHSPPGGTPRGSAMGVVNSASTTPFADSGRATPRVPPCGVSTWWRGWWWSVMMRVRPSWRAVSASSMLAMPQSTVTTMSPPPEAIVRRASWLRP
jgi:hypothetical protein